MSDFGNITVPPITIAKFKETYDLTNSWSIGFLLAQYMMYLDANEHQHHYNPVNGLMEWYVHAVDIYLESMEDTNAR